MVISVLGALGGIALGVFLGWGLVTAVHPALGGVLIRDASNHILGAIGISGDTGDNDEIIAVAGIEAAGLKPDPGGTKK